MQNFILFYLWLFVMALSFMGTLKSTLCERNHIISLNWGSYCTLPGLGWELALWNEEVNEFLYCNRGERNIPSFLFCSSSAGGHLCYWGNPVHEVTNVQQPSKHPKPFFFSGGSLPTLQSKLKTQPIITQQGKLLSSLPNGNHIRTRNATLTTTWKGFELTHCSYQGYNIRTEVIQISSHAPFKLDQGLTNMVQNRGEVPRRTFLCPWYGSERVPTNPHVHTRHSKISHKPAHTHTHTLYPPSCRCSFPPSLVPCTLSWNDNDLMVAMWRWKEDDPCDVPFHTRTTP